MILAHVLSNIPVGLHDLMGLLSFGLPCTNKRCFKKLVFSALILAEEPPHIILSGYFTAGTLEILLVTPKSMLTPGLILLWSPVESCKPVFLVQTVRETKFEQ